MTFHLAALDEPELRQAGCRLASGVEQHAGQVDSDDSSHLVHDARGGPGGSSRATAGIKDPLAGTRCLHGSTGRGSGYGLGPKGATLPGGSPMPILATNWLKRKFSSVSVSFRAAACCQVSR